MAAILIAFVVGVLACQVLPEIPVWPWQGLFPVLLLLTGLLWVRLKPSPKPPTVRRWVALALLLIGGFCTGVSYLCWRTSSVLADQLPEAAMGKNLQVVGVVDSLPERTPRGQRFLFKVEQVAAPYQVPELIQLSIWNKDSDEEADTQTALNNVKPGERWAFSVRLKRPHGAANPHGYDVEAHLFELGVRATGYVRGGERLDAFVADPATVIAWLRYRIRERFDAVLPVDEYPNAGTLIALAIGDQQAIPGSMWQVFAKTGTTHLMSISGLHVTLFSGLVAMLVSWLWRRQPRWVSRIPAQRAGVFCGWFAAAFYTLIAGAGVPALRTLFMLSVGALALLTGRYVSAFRILLLALVVVLLFDPWAGMSPGFWLSFVAVALLLWAAFAEQRADRERMTLRQRLWHALKGFGRTQWAVTIGTLPFLLIFFSQFSLISPLTNAIAIPWISAVVTPLTILALVVPWDGLLVVAHALLSPLMDFLQWSAALPAAIWHAPAPALDVFVLALVGALWWLLPAGLPGRWMALFLCLPLIFPRTEQIAAGQAQIDVLDVGQGLAVVIRTQHHSLLYDTGPYYSSTADAGNRVVVPYLRALGIDRLDGMVVTHRDTDHSGGALSVVESLPVAWVADAPGTHFADLAPEAERKTCVAGDGWQWDGVRFEFLYPESTVHPRDEASNHQSCVLRVSVAGKSLLLTADIESSDEQALLKSGLGHSDVLLVPHHGSGTSSSTEFLATVQPEIAIIPVGYRNRYRHPKPSVVSAYEERKIRLFRTDTGGMIQLELPSMEVSAYRQAHRRYWMDQPTVVPSVDQ